MQPNLDIDNFLTQNVRGKSRYENFLNFSKATHSNRETAQDAVSHLVTQLYSGKAKAIESYCFTVIKNFSWYIRKENHLHKKYSVPFSSINPYLPSDDLADELTYMNPFSTDHHLADREIFVPEFSNFFSYELWKEGKLSDERIHMLDKLRSVYSTLTPHDREIYKLVYVEGLSRREVARMKKISHSRVCQFCKELHTKIKIALEKNLQLIY